MPGSPLPSPAREAVLEAVNQEVSNFFTARQVFAIRLREIVSVQPCTVFGSLVGYSAAALVQQYLKTAFATGFQL